MQAVILAAGKGSRLQMLTDGRSKAMMPIAGKPMILRVMEMIKSTGLHEFIIVSHPHDHELKDLLGEIPEVKIIDQDERLGAAHALSLAVPFIHDDFLLSACDNLVNDEEAAALVQYFQTQPGKKPAGLLALIQIPKEKMQSMGMVTWDGKNIEHIIEKPSSLTAFSGVASIPLYCFSHHFLDYLPEVKPSIRGEYELQDAMQLMINATHNVHGKMVSSRLTLTNPKDLLELNLHFLDTKDSSLPKKFPDSILFTQPYLLEPGVDVEADCKIGPNVIIETSSKIGSGAVLRNALILRGAQVPAGEIVENRIFSNKRSINQIGV